MKKKILYSVLVLIFTVAFFYSCEDEDTIRFNIDNFSQGFLPFITSTENSEPGFNPDDLAGSSITVIVDLRAQETEELASPADGVSSIEVKAVYDNLLSPLTVPDEAIVATVTEWPAEITLTPQDMVAAFDSISSLEDITGGDVFTLSQRIVMKDGSVIDGIENQNTIEVYDTAGVSLGDLTYDTYNTDLQINESEKNSYEWNLFVNCASDISGSYSVVSEGEGGYGFGDPALVEAWSSEIQVTLTNVGLGVYECDGVIGGIMEDFYGPFGGTRSTGQFILLCNNAIQGIGVNDGWNPLVLYEGTYNPSNGEFTISWANPWGDSGTSVFSPN